jgi:RNA polymerase sigma factor (sigma-70 family)
VVGTGRFVADTVARNADAGATTDDDALVRAAKSGDPAARERLIERFMPLVVSQARLFHVEGLDFADAIQEGYVGLLRALERFDPDRGVPFAAYAIPWIRYGLQELRSDFMRPMRLPRQALRQLSQLKSEHQRVYVTERREPSLGELAERTGIDRDRVEELARANTFPRSLYEQVGVDEGPLGRREIGVLGDLLADPLSTDAYEQALDRIAGAQLRALLTRLTRREQEILAARLGLDGQEPQRQVDIAERLGVSVDRVRRLEQRALAKLRQAAESPADGRRPGPDQEGR